MCFMLGKNDDGRRHNGFFFSFVVFVCVFGIRELYAVPWPCRRVCLLLAIDFPI